ncbi:MAG: polyamine aminopropyltransferase [Chloroflexi bacterium]|nr:polyamine aminopropyltransferase [Chloroflexota bacterium]
MVPGERAAYEITQVLASARTQWQDVEIVETRSFGRALFLDGAPQSAAADEFVYHEALVHPSLVCHPAPKRVLIAGGGEGATLREVLRHPSVERAVMVDIDGELVDLCREHLAEMHQGAFDDPRADVVIGDALAYLRDQDDRFDVIVIDLTDPSEDGPIGELYGEEFYRLVGSRLAEDGIIVLQAYTFGPGRTEWQDKIAATLGNVFPIVRRYRAEVPFFKDSWAYCTASRMRDPAALPVGYIDRVLSERGVEPGLRFYDGTTHLSMFALPKYARR